MMSSDQQKGTVPDEVKKEIRAVLLSKVGGVPLAQFNGDFAKLVGHRLEWTKLGFSSLTHLLEAIPDVARIELGGKDQKPTVYGLSEKGMFMNCTAKKAQYREKEMRITSGDSTGTRWRDAECGHGSSRVSATAATQQILQNLTPEDQAMVKKYELELRPNQKGMYALCIPGKQGVSREQFSELFSKYGEITELAISAGKPTFVRYGSIEPCLAALIELGDLYDVRVGRERSEYNSAIKSCSGNMPSSPMSQDSANDDEPCSIFIGNLPVDLTDLELKDLLSGFKILKVRNIVRAAKHQRFAFVDTESRSEGQRLLDTLHQKKTIRGRLIVAEESRGKRKPPVEDTAILKSGVPPSNVAHSVKANSSEGQALCRNDAGDGPGSQPLGMLDGEQRAEPGLENMLKYRDNYREEGYGNDYADDCGYSDDCGYGNDYADQYGYHNDFRDYAGKEYDYESLERDHTDLYVANFPYDTEQSELMTLFKPFGAINVVMKRPNPTRTWRTGCFVWFPDFEAADAAVGHFAGTLFKGRPLTVSLAWSAKPQHDEFQAKIRSIKCIVPTGEDGKRHVMLEAAQVPDRRDKGHPAPFHHSREDQLVPQSSSHSLSPSDSMEATIGSQCAQDMAGQQQGHGQQGVPHGRMNRGGIKQHERTNQGGIQQHERRHQGGVQQYQKMHRGGIQQYERTHQVGIEQYERRHQGGVQQYDRGHQGGIQQYEKRHQGGIQQYERGHQGGFQQYERGHQEGIQQYERKHQGAIQQYKRGSQQNPQQYHQENHVRHRGNARDTYLYHGPARPYDGDGLQQDARAVSEGQRNRNSGSPSGQWGSQLPNANMAARQSPQSRLCLVASEPNSASTTSSNVSSTSAYPIQNASCEATLQDGAVAKPGSPDPLALLMGKLETMCRDCCPSSKFPKKPELPTTIQILPTHPLDDTYVWVNAVYEDVHPEIEEYQMQINQLRADPNAILVPLNREQRRAACCYEGDWCRTWVMHVGDKQAKVFFIDYGNIETVAVDKLMNLPSEFWKVRPLALPVELQGMHVQDLATTSLTWVEIVPGQDNEYPLLVRGIQ